MKLFEDMWSSHRGAGVMGTLIAVGILIALGSLFILVTDERFAGGEKTIESQIRDQGKQIENLTDQIASHKAMIVSGQENQGIAEKIESLSKQQSAREQKTAVTKTQIEQAAADIASLQRSWEQYKTKYRAFIRNKNIGSSYPEIQTQSGRKFTNVTIRKIDDLRVSISHSDGSGTIPWDDLPADMIRLLQFTPELAEARRKSENQAAQHFSNAATSSDIQESITFIEEKMKDATAQFEKKRSAANNSPSIIANARADIQRLQQMIVQEMSKEGLRQTPRYRSQILDHEKTIRSEQDKVAEFSRIQTRHDEQMADWQNQIATLRQKLSEVR
jgi:hypothetical protein